MLGGIVSAGADDASSIRDLDVAALQFALGWALLTFGVLLVIAGLAAAAVCWQIRRHETPPPR